MFQYRMKWKRHHDSVYWFDLKTAQDQGLVLWKTMSHAIVREDSMPAECLTKVVRYNHEILYHRSQSGPQVAPKVTLRPTFARDLSAISADTSASDDVSVSKWSKKFMAKFQTGLERLDAHTGKTCTLYERTIPGRAPGRNRERRKSEDLDLPHCAIYSEPSRQGQFGGRLAKQV